MKKTLQILLFALIAIMMPIGILAQENENVAKVGDTEYTTFDEALTNWTDGTTLTLLTDITGLTERIKTFAKGLTLDLNGHKIESSDNWTIWVDGDSGSELTIRDTKGGGYIQGCVYAVAGGSTLRLESGTVEEVTANGDFTMTGGRIVCENDIALYVNAYVNVLISGGEISGKHGVYGSIANNITVTGIAKITATNGYAIYSRFVAETIIDGTPILNGTKGEISTKKKIIFNTQPADDTVWHVAIDTEYNKDGIFATPGEGIALDISRFASSMEGYELKQNAKGELLLCNHQTAYVAVSNDDGSTHKTTCTCGEVVIEEHVACSGGMATCRDKAVCEHCGQSYGETNPNIHTFDDDGKCVCGAEIGEAISVDLSALTATYIINDSEEYIFTGTGNHGVKVECGNPKIVLNNANVTLNDGDYYEGNPINGIHIASASGTTIIQVKGENSITTKAGAGIFVAKGGTVKITGTNREDILNVRGAAGCNGIGGYVFYNNDLFAIDCGNIEISNVTVRTYGSLSDLGDMAPAIGASGNANCGYVTIDNADVYAEGYISPYGYEGSSAIGTGVDFIYYEGGTIGEISIVNNSIVYVTRGAYCDYIGSCGHEYNPTEGVVDATAKSSTIYCYDTVDATEPVKTLKYGALGGLLKEDGTCEGEHSFTGNICDNCGYCSCTHEGGELTYAPTEDGSQHTYTCSLCGTTVTEAHNYHGSICIDCGHFDADATEVEIYDGYYSRVIIDDDYDVEKLTYYRELPNQEWNSLYVPFEIEVTDELLEDYEVAYMNNMHTYDADDDGSIDKMDMEIIKIKNGTLKANYPYFIRAKNTEAMDMNLVIENALVESTVGRTVSCQSIRSIFELRGIYERMRQVDFAEMYGTHYAISTEGGWWQTEGLDPFRAYLTNIPRSGTPVNGPAMNSISIRSIGITVRGEENTTGVTEVKTENGEGKTEIYDLQGRRINKITESGIYIVNGKKIKL